MAIQEVDNIPKTSRVQRAQPFEYTEKITADIRQAYDNHIPMFEFIDYDNPAYVVSYAKDLAYKFIQKELYTPYRVKIEAEVKKRFKKVFGKGVDYIKIRLGTSAEPAIKIIGVTVNGEKRVFGSIDFDYIVNFEDIMVDRFCKYYPKPEVQTDILRRVELDEFKAELNTRRNQNG